MDYHLVLASFHNHYAHGNLTSYFRFGFQGSPFGTEVYRLQSVVSETHGDMIVNTRSDLTVEYNSKQFYRAIALTNGGVAAVVGAYMIFGPQGADEALKKVWQR